MLNNQLLAQKLLETGAVRIQADHPFTWASGLRSPIYCDNRLLLSHPDIRTGVIDLMVKVINYFESFDVIAGVATAGIPHGTLLADRLKLPFAYIRSKPKEHGRQNLIEGHIAEGSKVLVVEDLISTGMSSLQAVEAVRHIPAHVCGVISIFQYGFPSAHQAFAEAGCPFQSLTDFNTILEQAVKGNYIKEDQVAFLSEWSADPHGWSARFISASV